MKFLTDLLIVFLKLVSILGMIISIAHPERKPDVFIASIIVYCAMELMYPQNK